MKMNLHQLNSHGSKRRTNRIPRSFFIVLGVVVFAILINIFAFGIVSRSLQAIARPLWSAQVSTTNSLSTFFNFIHSKKALIEENKRLGQEITTLKLLSVTSDVVQKENEALRAIGLREDNTERVVGAVISRPNRSLYDTLIIDIGWQHGVKKDSPVFGEENVLIGRIAGVYAKTALVQLYSSPGVTIDVIVGHDEVSAEAVGRGGGNFEIILPRGIIVEEGDTVASPSLGGGVVGVVGEIVLHATDPFQTILLRSPITIQSLRMITVAL